MAGTYVVGLELASQVTIEVEADDEEDAIQKAFDQFDLNFECHATDIRLSEWDAEIIESPEEEA